MQNLGASPQDCMHEAIPVDIAFCGLSPDFSMGPAALGLSVYVTRMLFIQHKVPICTDNGPRGAISLH